MSAMGRIDADYEEKLLLKQEAAEEMYEALKAVLNQPFGKASFEMARKAIAKAEGR